MKKYLMLSVAILTLSAGAAYAEDGSEHKGEHHKGERAAQMFDEADVNDDGQLSKEEFLSRHEKKFVEIDTNADGQLSKEEMEARRQQWMEKHKAAKEAADGAAPAETPAESPAEEVAPTEGAE